MDNFSTTTIIAVCAIIFIKLYYQNKKLKSKLFNNEDQLVDEDKNHTESQNAHNGVQDTFIDEKRSTLKLLQKIPFYMVQKILEQWKKV